LLWGPLSDKYGRKPVLVAGLTLYVISIVLCACVTNVYQLIVFRIFQAVGGSAASAVATAIVKDVYHSRDRESVLAIVQSMVMISPALAPVLGAFMLSFTTWRGIFWSLAVIGLVSLAGSLAYRETIGKLYTGNILQSLSRLGTVARNPGFTSLVIVFTLTSISTMAFVASSSYIYEDGFGLSAQMYSYYFALNALGLLAGPMLYLKLSARFERKCIINACFAMIALSGILVYFLGQVSPIIFALSILPATIAGVCSRPPGTNMMLEQQKEDTGSASSLIGCTMTIMGSIGMLLVSFSHGSLIPSIGILNVATGLLCLVLWQFLSKQPFVKPIQDTA
jgi:DHA1 family bicyclomycin/chloramphenicol resistance-like MFS transporter